MTDFLGQTVCKKRLGFSMRLKKRPLLSMAAVISSSASVKEDRTVSHRLHWKSAGIAIHS